MPNNSNAQGNQANGSNQNPNSNNGAGNNQNQGSNQGSNNNQNQGSNQGSNTATLYTEDQVMQILKRDAATIEEAKENSRMWMSISLVGAGLARFAPHPGVKAFGFGLTLVSLAKASRALDGE